jgi:ribosomal protein S8
MKAWIQLLSLIKEAYLVKRLKVVRVKYSKFAYELCSLMLKQGFIKSFEIKNYYNSKKKQQVIGIFIQLKYFKNKTILKDIKIISPCRFGTRQGRVGLKYKQIKNLNNADCFLFSTDKGLVFGNYTVINKIGGFPICKFIF